MAKSKIREQPELRIREIEPDFMRKLQKRAKENCRSMSSEAKYIIKKELDKTNG